MSTSPTNKDEPRGFREVNESISRKSAWLLELTKNRNHNGGAIDAEIDAELARRYGVSAYDWPPQAPDLDSQLAEIRLARNAGDTARAAELQDKLVERVSEGLGERLIAVPAGDAGPQGERPAGWTEADAINREIAEAERNGDLEGSLRAKAALAQLRNSQMNPTGGID